MTDHFEIAAKIRSIVQSFGPMILTEWNYVPGPTNRHFSGSKEVYERVLGGYEFRVKTKHHEGRVNLFLLDDGKYVINIHNEYYEDVEESNLYSALNYYITGVK